MTKTAILDVSSSYDLAYGLLIMQVFCAKYRSEITKEMFPVGSCSCAASSRSYHGGHSDNLRPVPLTRLKPTLVLREVTMTSNFGSLGALGLAISRKRKGIC